MRNYYEVLQVFPNATQQEIKDAFRFLLFRYHPDHNKGKEEWAVEQTMSLVEAYHILSDSARRLHHDVMRTVKLREDLPKKGLFGRNKSKDLDPLFREAIEKYKSGEVEQAIGAFRKVYDADPGYPNIGFNMGVCFLAIERMNDALQWLADHAARNKGDADSRALHAKIGTLAQKMKAARVAAGAA
ncbi:MAG: DnaJ domain-containing protein [Candidatus Coatesbacteria bacterium]